MLTMEDLTTKHLHADLYNREEQFSALTEDEREAVAMRLRAIAMQLDRADWQLAADGFREMVAQLIDDARTTIEVHSDARKVSLSLLRLKTSTRGYLEKAGVETLHDLRCVGDAWLLAIPQLNVEALREIRGAQRRWYAERLERLRLARLKLRNTKFAKRLKTP